MSQPWSSCESALLPHDNQRLAIFLLAAQGKHDGFFIVGNIDFSHDAFIRDIGSFREGQQQREASDFFPVGRRKHHRVAVGAHDFIADAMMEARDERCFELFELAHAVERCMRDDEGRMARVVVVIDDFARVVQPGRDFKQAAVATRRLVRFLQLVKQAQREIFDTFEMLHAAVGTQKIILHALAQNIFDNRAVAVFLSVIFEEDTVAQAAAGNDDVLSARELHQGIDDDAASDDEVGTLRGKALHAAAG